MKVGILTLPLLNNYGGILQAVALYNYLEGIGHEPVLLTKKFDRPIHQRLIGAILRQIPGHRIGNIRKFKKQRALHHPFLANFMPRRSRALYSLKALSSYVQRNKIECVIVGSDQVWRPEYVSDHESRVFFLDFEGGFRKVSYAASFGNSKWTRPEGVHNITKMLSSFDAVSVRELSGVEFCRNTMARADCMVALDPTMLIDTKFYDNFTGDRSAAQGYVLNYVLDTNPSFQNISESAKIALGGNRVTRSVSLEDGFETATIPEWLEALRHADLVVTDSFHGTVFSILFRKQFIAVANVERGVDRFQSLLGQLGLSDRLINNDSPDVVSRLALVPIDYDAVHAELDKLRGESRAFLNDALR